MPTAGTTELARKGAQEVRRDAEERDLSVNAIARSRSSGFEVIVTLASLLSGKKRASLSERVRSAPSADDLQNRVESFVRIG